MCATLSPVDPHDTVRRYADAWAANDISSVFDARV